MRQENYGDIHYGDHQNGTVESLRGTAAKNLADELSHHRGEYKDHQDAGEAINYIESLGYSYDYINRAWRYTG